MTPILGHRYSLLGVVGAGFVVAAPLVTWLAVSAVTAERPLPRTLALAPCDSAADLPAVDANAHAVVAADDAIDLHELAQHAHIVPVFESGRVIGAKLFAIAPGSLYAQAGLENGDIVTRVNGVTLKSPDDGMRAYESLRGSRVLVVDFLRRGERGTLTHSLPSSPSE